MLDHQSMFWGVRLSKPDGDDEYNYAMTRPDPPYRANIKPAIAAGEQQEEKLVIHETKVAGARVEERLVHVYCPSEEAFAYLSVGVADDGSVARADWRVVDATGAAVLGQQGVPHVDVPLPDDDAFLDWMAEMFVEMAQQQIIDDGGPRTQDEVLRRSAALVAEWLGMPAEQAQEEFDAWAESTQALDKLDRDLEEDDEFQLDPTVDVAAEMAEYEELLKAAYAEAREDRRAKRQGLWARIADAYETACIWLYVNTIGRIR